MAIFSLTFWPLIAETLSKLITIIDSSFAMTIKIYTFIEVVGRNFEQGLSQAFRHYARPAQELINFQVVLNLIITVSLAFRQTFSDEFISGLNFVVRK